MSCDGDARPCSRAPRRGVYVCVCASPRPLNEVAIHKDGKLKQIMHLSEIMALVRYKSKGGLKSLVAITDEHVAFCNDAIGKVSRSFTAVIRQLPESLCLDIMVFYLVLRALDTIEDDMDAFKEDVSVKIRHLQTFHELALNDTAYSMSGVGQGDEAWLLENFGHVVHVFKALPPASQVVIADITRQMGNGMAEFVHKDLGEGTTTIEEYNRYCHYVAGLVGHGLSRLFASSGLEADEIGSDLDLANDMGLFLQKTNIIRDYLEDYVDGRAWWPQEVWKQYSKSGELGEFADPAARKQALACLSHLITDALELVPRCIAYMERLRNRQVFCFCAIPQVMAIATLEKCFNNKQVFTGVVKIRKGLMCKVMLDTHSIGELNCWFNEFAHKVRRRIDPADPSAKRTTDVCDRCAACGSRCAACVGYHQFPHDAPLVSRARGAWGVGHVGVRAPKALRARTHSRSLLPTSPGY